MTLVAEASGERNGALYIAALHTGLRKGELLGLKWTDLDLDGGTLSVRRSLTTRCPWRMTLRPASSTTKAGHPLRS